jgi:hypothetical protein
MMGGAIERGARWAYRAAPKLIVPVEDKAYQMAVLCVTTKLARG